MHTDHPAQTLTATDRELLDHWFDPLTELKKFAAKHKMDLLDLRRWAQQPHISAALDDLELFVERHARAVALASISTTASTLGQVAAEQDLDPDVRRKAATILHRTALRFRAEYTLPASPAPGPTPSPLNPLPIPQSQPADQPSPASPTLRIAHATHPKEKGRPPKRSAPSSSTLGPPRRLTS